MGQYAADDFLDFQLRRNRLDGPGLYYGRRGRYGPVAGETLAPFLRAWVERDVYKRTGFIPLLTEGLFDDGLAHEGEALLGDRLVDFEVDDDGVVSGTSLEMLERFVANKAKAMTADDESGFSTLAEAHGVPVTGLLDGPWTALLWRVNHFGLGAVPQGLVLIAGVGMQPKGARHLPLPEGFERWEQSWAWQVVGRPVATVEAPARTLVVDLEHARRELAAAQQAVLTIAETPPWQAMMTRQGWTEVDLEVCLCVHLAS